MCPAATLNLSYTLEPSPASPTPATCSQLILWCLDNRFFTCCLSLSLSLLLLFQSRLIKWQRQQDSPRARARALLNPMHHGQSYLCHAIRFLTQKSYPTVEQPTEHLPGAQALAHPRHFPLRMLQFPASSRPPLPSILQMLPHKLVSRHWLRHRPRAQHKSMELGRITMPRVTAFSSHFQA